MLRLGVVLCALLAAAGCPGPREAPTTGVSVVAGFYPLVEAAQRVGGERVEVTNVTPAGAEPHDLELTTAQIDLVVGADVVVFARGFQPALDEAVERTEGRPVDVLDGLDLIDGDPHVWLDPRLMSAIVDRVERALTRADPAGRNSYSERAEAYRTELKGLDEAFTSGLRDCERRSIVVNHASFTYLADRYGLRQEPISGTSPEAEADPERMDEVIAFVRSEGVTTVFAEKAASPRTVQTLARETGVEVAVLDPLEALSDEEIARGRSYMTVMGENLSALSRALACR